jgi:hypothetical protein
MPRPDTDPLIEQAVGAWRPTGPLRGILPHPAWCDLPAEVRAAAFDATLRSRAIESALDPEGCSGTVRAVLRRLES